MTDPLIDENDPIEIILAFARQIEGARLQRDPMQIHAIKPMTPWSTTWRDGWLNSTKMSVCPPNPFAR